MRALAKTARRRRRLRDETAKGDGEAGGGAGVWLGQIEVGDMFGAEAMGEKGAGARGRTLTRLVPGALVRTPQRSRTIYIYMYMVVGHGAARWRFKCYKPHMHISFQISFITRPFQPPDERWVFFSFQSPPRHGTCRKPTSRTRALKNKSFEHVPVAIGRPFLSTGGRAKHTDRAPYTYICCRAATLRPLRLFIYSALQPPSTRCRELMAGNKCLAPRIICHHRRTRTIRRQPGLLALLLPATR